ncbi:hypothetical protein BKA62DRAFT_758558 [Auriculariales sp. MPI-PUGE-AT-0066]|nr:hypothetical protein BKA62DRAFT_758558 [Auriculariales sp. MPI-PUGE-AT-0066]
MMMAVLNLTIGLLALAAAASPLPGEDCAACPLLSHSKLEVQGVKDAFGIVGVVSGFLAIIVFAWSVGGSVRKMLRGCWLSRAAGTPAGPLTPFPRSCSRLGDSRGPGLITMHVSGFLNLYTPEEAAMSCSSLIPCLLRRAVGITTLDMPPTAVSRHIQLPVHRPI